MYFIIKHTNPDLSFKAGCSWSGVLKAGPSRGILGYRVASRRGPPVPKVPENVLCHVLSPRAMPVYALLEHCFYVKTLFYTLFKLNGKQRKIHTLSLLNATDPLVNTLANPPPPSRLKGCLLSIPWR